MSVPIPHDLSWADPRSYGWPWHDPSAHRSSKNHQIKR